MVSPIFERTLEISLKSEKVNFNTNMSMTSLFHQQYRHDPTLFDLNRMNDVNRVQLRMPDLMQHSGLTVLFNSKIHYSWNSL